MFSLHFYIFKLDFVKNNCRLINITLRTLYPLIFINFYHTKFYLDYDIEFLFSEYFLTIWIKLKYGTYS